MYEKQQWENDISRKDASQLPASFIKVFFFQNVFSHKFCWSKSKSGAFYNNPVDIQRLIDVETTSCVYSVN